MRINPQIFRQYDIRGIAEKDITEDFSYKLGLAFGTIMRNQNKKRCSVGYDVRKTSPKYKEALCDGLREAGVEVVELGMVPTSLMYFSLFNIDVEGGIEVTASHNPKEFNGFKLCLGKETFYGEQIQILREIMEKETWEKRGRATREEYNIIPDYVSFVKDNIKITKEIKVGIDNGNGVGGVVLKELLKKFPQIKYKDLYFEPDGDFPHHLPDPTVEKYMQDLKKLVIENKLELGIGLDGDADRIGAVDEDGNIIYGDKLLALYAYHILKNLKGAEIILDVKCSKGVIEFIERNGGKVYMWKTGHSLIKAKLKERKAPFAGEMSGHMFFNDKFFGYDDAIYAMLRLFELLSEENKTLKELVNLIPFYYSTPEIRVDCPDEHKFRIVSELVEKFKNEGYNVIDIDGARIEFEDGFALVRASNTQPVLVLRFEAKTKERLQEIKKLIYKKLSEYKEVKL